MGGVSHVLACASQKRRLRVKYIRCYETESSRIELDGRMIAEVKHQVIYRHLESGFTTNVDFSAFGYRKSSLS